MGEKTFWETLLDVHATTTGNLVRSEEEHERDIKSLEDKLEKWQYSGHYAELFDSLVKALAVIAVNEARTNVTKETFDTKKTLEEGKVKLGGLKELDDSPRPNWHPEPQSRETNKI